MNTFSLDVRWHQLWALGKHTLSSSHKSAHAPTPSIRSSFHLCASICFQNSTSRKEKILHYIYVTRTRFLRLLTVIKSTDVSAQALQCKVSARCLLVVAFFHSACQCDYMASQITIAITIFVITPPTTTVMTRPAPSSSSSSS